MFNAELCEALVTSLLTFIAGVWAFFTLALKIRERYDEARASLLDVLDGYGERPSPLRLLQASFSFQAMGDLLKALKAALYMFSFACVLISLILASAPDLSTGDRLLVCSPLIVIVTIVLATIHYQIPKDQTERDKPQIDSACRAVGVEANWEHRTIVVREETNGAADE